MKETLPEVKIPKSFGFGIGIFVREPKSDINEKN